MVPVPRMPENGVPQTGLVGYHVYPKVHHLKVPRLPRNVNLYLGCNEQVTAKPSNNYIL